MRHTSRALSFFIMPLLVLASFNSAPAAPEAPWMSKVDPWVVETGASGDTEFLVFLTEQADLSGAENLPTKQEKGAYVYQRLTEVAERTQPAVIAALGSRAAEYRPYWVANMIWVRGGLDAVQAMAERSDIAHVYANPAVKADLPSPATALLSPDAPEAVEWNISWVNADDVWAAGYTGQGAVIGGQDTGYDWEHPALKNQYRGWNGIAADHNFNWHDAIHSSDGAVCDPDSLEPCDDHGHGTHTMGTMVGDDGSNNQIGMAPGARWIGCRNMDEGVGTPATYAECYQWFIAPTDLNNQNPNSALAPDVINNSWGCPPSEGCTDPNVLESVVNAVRAAGILTAHSAGNNGAVCSSINEPAAIYEASFTVGATGDHTDNIAGFSSRGPVTIDGSGRRKPDVSAPGVNIRSSIPGGGYQGGWQGTSMAAPHVAGEVALLISANPGLKGQVSALESIIEQSALPRTTTQNCGGDSSSDVPNNVYGWGRIDALAALQTHLLMIDKSASQSEVFPGEMITYTIDITHISPAYPTTNVVITDTLPAGTSFVTATSPHSFDGSTVRWDIASLAASETQSVELVVQVQPGASGTVDNLMYGVRSDDVSTVLGDPVSTTIADISHVLEKTASETVIPGSTLTYTLSVTNPYASMPMHNVVLTDVLPADTSFIAATQPVVHNGDLITWTLPLLPVGDTWSVQLAVSAPNVFSGSIVNQDYGVRSDEFSTARGSPVATSIQGLVLNKSAMPDLVKVGDSITYTLTVANQHPISTTHNLVLTDTIPENTAFISSDGTLDSSGVVSWTLSSLPAGQTWSAQLVVEVLPGAYAKIDNLEYGVRSEEVPDPILGEVVSTHMEISTYLPVIYRQ